LGWFLILINPKLRKKGAIALWKRVLKKSFCNLPPTLKTPLSDTANFSDYATGGFDQVRLRDLAVVSSDRTFYRHGKGNFEGGKRASSHSECFANARVRVQCDLALTVLCINKL
jgi:hypothetical protein